MAKGTKKPATTTTGNTKGNGKPATAPATKGCGSNKGGCK